MQAEIVMLKDGRYFLQFDVEATALIKARVFALHGKSTKRINKKRVKRYMDGLVTYMAKQSINVVEG